MTDDTVSVRNEGAHHLLLPKDWPVKEENGRLAPIGIEEYMSMKFAQVRELFSVHERRFDLIEKRLKALEKNNTILQSRLSLLEEAQERDSASSK